MQVDCRCCKRRSLCPLFSDRCHQALIAWANDLDLPGCNSFAPNYYRGVEGVFDATAHSVLN